MSEQCRTIQSSRDLGAFIYDARTQRNLTQESLANKANVSRSWLIGLEQGKRPRAEMDKILSLLRALDISLSLQTMQAHEVVAEDQIVEDNPAEESSEHKAPSSDQAARPLSDANQILGNVAGAHMQNIAKVLGANTPSIEKALRANIPNFGQASGITRALDRKEKE